MPNMLSIFLRIGTLGCKFLLIILMAKFLSVNDFGLYGLLTVTVGYSIYLVGFDFYNYTTRELVSLSPEKWGRIFKAQGMLTLILYFLFIPVCSLFFVFGFMPSYLFVWFVGLLVVEHVCQEITRILISASFHVAASAVIFLRTGAWALVCSLLMILFPGLRVLELVLGGWIVGGVMACALGVVCLSGLKISGWSDRVDMEIIKFGIKVSLPLLISTLAMRAIFTVDRYLIDAYGNSETLAAYVLFAGVATTLMSLLDAAVYFPSYPKLIKFHSERGVKEFMNIFRRMLVLATFIAVAFMAFNVFAIEYVLKWLGKAIYLERLEMFYWVLAGMVIYSLSMVPHYGLYAKKLDEKIIFCHCFSLIIFILSGVIFVDKGGASSIPMALCITFSFMLVCKSFFFAKACFSRCESVRIND
ncbi:MAG: hypothetical protein R3E57_02495 [Porticoccaceae bacterium]